VFQSKIHKDKCKQTCLDKYGVEHISMSNLIKDKNKQTCLDKYGVEYFFQSDNFKLKCKKSCLDKYGVEHISMSNLIKDKSKQTCLDKYGVEHFVMSKTFTQNSFKYKPYEFKNGKTVNIQGYEPFALKILENIYNPDNILTGLEIKPIKYKYKNSKKTYYPDIYLPSKNLMIEVKSNYTYTCEIVKNICKKLSCIKQGFNFEFWIFDSKGTLNIV
jgi:hypothetical protein